MKIALFSTQAYEKRLFDAQKGNLAITYFAENLNEKTVPLAEGYDILCCFVQDKLSANVIAKLAQYGVKGIALRSAGFNHVDLQAAARHQIAIARVPAYSPHAIAEHTIGLMLALNRHIHRAHNRIREGNFSLHGLMGFDLYKKTVGIIGTGKIGSALAHILKGFSCDLLGYDIHEDPTLSEATGLRYVPLDELFAESHIISLHCPLTAETQHLIDTNNVNKMRDNVMLINTSRGALIDTNAVIAGLKSKKIGYLGLDVYEEEEHLFFADHSDDVLLDDNLARLLTFPNVIITGHQAFFTKEALQNIVKTTIENITALSTNKQCANIININDV